MGDSPIARLATVTAAGLPHVVPCCFAVTSDARALYSAVDGKPKSTSALKRLDNIRANPAASLVADHYADDWTQLWWVRVDGPATIVEDRSERERALDLLASKYEQYRAVRPHGAVVKITPQRWVAWSATEPQSGSA